jgi:D-glycero-D-manno-heptose 1,7-bisphosphate phosphatase
MRTPAVFLDRDGTLIEDVGYLDRLQRVQLYSWSIEAVRLMQRAGFAVVIVTNQAGVARGMLNEKVVHEVFEYLQKQCLQAGTTLAGHYYCPHLPDAPLLAYRQECECRKPKPGMLYQAAADLDLSLEQSFVIGDRWTDVQLAHVVGARGILVKTGYGATQINDRPDNFSAADAYSEHLLEAVGWVLKQD